MNRFLSNYFDLLLRYIVSHQGATLQRHYQLRHDITRYSVTTGRGDNATALVEFALSDIVGLLFNIYVEISVISAMIALLNTHEKYYSQHH